MIFHANCLREGHHHFPRQFRVKSRKPWGAWKGSCPCRWGSRCHGGWSDLFHWQKRTSSEFKVQCRQFHLGLPTHPNLLDLLLFQSMALTLTVDTLGGWEFNWLYNSANYRMRSCIWFSAISALQLQEISLSLRAHLEALGHSCGLELGIGIPELILFSHHFVQQY